MFSLKTSFPYCLGLGGSINFSTYNPIQSQNSEYIEQLHDSQHDQTSSNQDYPLEKRYQEDEQVVHKKVITEDDKTTSSTFHSGFNDDYCSPEFLDQDTIQLIQEETNANSFSLLTSTISPPPENLGMDTEEQKQDLQDNQIPNRIYQNNSKNMEKPSKDIFLPVHLLDNKLSQQEDGRNVPIYSCQQQTDTFIHQCDENQQLEKDCPGINLGYESTPKNITHLETKNQGQKFNFLFEEQYHQPTTFNSHEDFLPVMPFG